ncbi:MAG: hypothetical protein ACRDMV_01435 [Streptosporangiales bacterium]
MSATQNETEYERLHGWFAGRLPDDWFEGPPELTLDRDEVLVVGTVAAPRVDDDASDATRTAAEQGRIKQFREDTRDRRVRIAQEFESAGGRKVAWGAVCGGTRELFTVLSVPAMTRLRQPERQVLDTLVDAGVARSRSDALGWCVRLVAKNADSWLAELRDALQHVERARAGGPDAGTGTG